MEIRVAIFEDNKLVRDALQAILNGTPGFTCCWCFCRWQQLGTEYQKQPTRCGVDGY